MRVSRRVHAIMLGAVGVVACGRVGSTSPTSARARSAVDPAREQLEYLEPGGQPSMALTSTTAPNTFALALNTQPGPTHITAQATGYTFLDQTITSSPART